MKLKIAKIILVLTLTLSLLITGCNIGGGEQTGESSYQSSSSAKNPDTSSSSQQGSSQSASQSQGKPPSNPSESSSSSSDLGDDDKVFGTEIEDTGAMDGYFEGESEDFTVTCISGTPNAFSYENSVLTFNELSEDSVYSISGSLTGSIVINAGDDFKLELELSGFTLISSKANPIVINSGNEVKIQAKKDTLNYIYDKRDKVDDADETLYSGAIYSLCDLEISGKGTLNIVSDKNNGIHSKDDLQVKNLTLLVTCADNALKGNDSVEISEAVITLIATEGDGIKTTSSDISESTQKQRGTVSILGGSVTIYAACDGIDSSYNVVIDGDSTALNIYTDKYSSYSDEVTDTSESLYYVRYSKNTYYYSVKYYNSDTDYIFVTPEYHSSVSNGRNGSYYYYSFPKKSEYQKLKLYVYENQSQVGSETDYYLASEGLSLNDSYDTLAISSRWGSASISWTSYSSSSSQPSGGMGGPGGMQEGNSDKGAYSTKGIKASNEIVVNNGIITVKSYDDALHASNTDTLENGASALGNITINGGELTLYSNDDGLHADWTLLISAGSINILNSYEGVEGAYVKIGGGALSVISKDDGINATSTSGTSIEISGGKVYIYCNGDGIDSNSKASYSGISFSGGTTVVISTSGGNSAIDSEAGYKFTGGTVVALMPSGGMATESSKVENLSSIGATKTMSLSSGQYLVVTVGNANITVKLPCSLSAYVVLLGGSNPTASTQSSTDKALDSNGVSWE